MEFLRFNGEEINLGLVQRFDFEPAWKFDPNCPNFKRMQAGEPVDESTIRKIPVPRVRIFFHLHEPIETTDPYQIERWRGLFAKRTIMQI